MSILLLKIAVDDPEHNISHEQDFLYFANNKEGFGLATFLFYQQRDLLLQNPEFIIDETWEELKLERITLATLKEPRSTTHILLSIDEDEEITYIYSEDRTKRWVWWTKNPLHKIQDWNYMLE